MSGRLVIVDQTTRDLWPTRLSAVGYVGSNCTGGINESLDDF